MTPTTASPPVPAMSDRLTAAGEALVAEVHGTTMALVVFPARIRAIETEAAARAVDEALSVADVVRMLEGIRRDIEVMGEDGECSLRTIRGVQYVTKDDAMHAVDDRLGVMRFRAAADSDITTTDVDEALRGPR